MKNWREPEGEIIWESRVGGEASSEMFSLNTLSAAYLYWFEGLACFDLGIFKSQFS